MCFISVFRHHCGCAYTCFLSVCSDIRVEDEGLYTCVAQNPFGKSDASAFVSVTGIGECVSHVLLWRVLFNLYSTQRMVVYLSVCTCFSGICSLTVTV